MRKHDYMQRLPVFLYWPDRKDLLQVVQRTPILNVITSNFARRLVNSNHNYSDLEANLETLHTCEKNKCIDATEEYELYKIIKSRSNNVSV